MILEPGFPCGIVERGMAYRLRGRVMQTPPRLQIARTSPGRDWSYLCVDAADDGTFDLEVSWGREFGDAGFFMISSARPEGCFPFQGWETSTKIWIR